MKRCWKLFLYSILLVAIVTASIVPAASKQASEAEANESSSSPEVDTPHRGWVIGEAFRYLTSMLGLLDVTLRQTNSTLEAHLSEYPFLAGTLEGTSDGVAAVDSMLLVLDPDQQVVNRTSLEEVGLSENQMNGNFEELNSSLESQELMLEAANSTLGANNVTTDLLNSMHESIKYMIGSGD